VFVEVEIASHIIFSRQPWKSNEKVYLFYDNLIKLSFCITQVIMFMCHLCTQGIGGCDRRKYHFIKQMFFFFFFFFNLKMFH
jgi:hypothetical protein